MHTIHGLCHLCIGCRLPQVCPLGADHNQLTKDKIPFFKMFLFSVHQGRKESATTPWGWNNRERM